MKPLLFCFALVLSFVLMVSKVSAQTPGATACYTLACTSDASFGGVTSSLPWEHVFLGDDFGCMATNSSKVRNCFGNNIYNQTRITFTGALSQVSMGKDFTCALTTTGVLLCYGRNNQLQVSGKPVGGPWSKVSLGGETGCVLDTTGAVTCWGDSANGNWVPANETAGPFEDISTGKEFTCVLQGGAVRCWGGDPSNPALQHAAIPVASNMKTLSEGLGISAACVLNDQRELTCWGDTSNGGDSTGVPPFSFDNLCMGELFGCASAFGTVYCWGQTPTNYNNLASTLPNPVVVDVSCSAYDICVLSYGDCPSPSPSSSRSPSRSASGSRSATPTRSSSRSPSNSVSPSVTASISASFSTSPSTSQSASISASVSISPAVSPSAKPSASESPSQSASRSASSSSSESPSISPSVTPSGSTSLSSSISPSFSRSTSTSPSHTASVSTSLSKSTSTSSSPSLSSSRSASPSPSKSLSATGSRSPSPSSSTAPTSAPSPSTSRSPVRSSSASASASQSSTPSATRSAASSPSTSVSPTSSPVASASVSVSPAGSPSRTASMSTSLSASYSASASRSPVVTTSGIFYNMDQSYSNMLYAVQYVAMALDIPSTTTFGAFRTRLTKVGSTTATVTVAVLGDNNSAPSQTSYFSTSFVLTTPVNAAMFNKTLPTPVTLTAGRYWIQWSLSAYTATTFPALPYTTSTTFTGSATLGPRLRRNFNTFAWTSAFEIPYVSF